MTESQAVSTVSYGECFPPLMNVIPRVISSGASSTITPSQIFYMSKGISPRHPRSLGGHGPSLQLLLASSPMPAPGPHYWQPAPASPWPRPHAFPATVRHSHLRSLRTHTGLGPVLWPLTPVVSTPAPATPPVTQPMITPGSRYNCRTRGLPMMIDTISCPGSHLASFGPHNDQREIPTF